MNFPTPAVDVSNETETNTETETETVFDGRTDEYETYWAVVDAYRFLGKLARTYLFIAEDRENGVTNADIAALVDRSPIARDWQFYKETKDEIKDDLNDRRGSDFPQEASLPTYKDEMETPDFDCMEITEDTLEDFGIAADTWSDRDELICLPSEYEPETDDEGNLLVYFAEEGDEVSDDAVLEAFRSVDRIGDVKATEALEALKEAGYTVVHN
jgi:hypothetical protein